MNTKIIFPVSRLVWSHLRAWTLAVVTACLFVAPVFAVDGTWSGTTSPDSWGVAENWSGSAVPGDVGSTVTIAKSPPYTAIVELDGDRTVGIMNIGAGANYTIASGTGGTLFFDNGANKAQLNFDGDRTHTISAPIELSSSLDIDSTGPSGKNRTLSGDITASGTNDTARVITNGANVGGAQLRISGKISDGAGARVISIHQNVAGSILRLDGDNAFTGGVKVSAGTLALYNGGGSSENALGAGTLNLNGGSLNFIGASPANYGNNTVISANSTIDLTFNPSAGDTITLGALLIDNPLSSDEDIVTVRNTASASNLLKDALVFGATTLTGNTTFAVTSAPITPMLLSLGALNGSSNLTKTGTGELELSAAAGTYSGTTILNAGTMIVGNNTSLGAGKVVMSGASAATLQIGSGIKVANNIVYSNTNGSSSISRVVASGTTLNVGTTGTLSSEFAGGKDNTTAAFRAGTAAVTTTLTMSFADASAAANDGIRISDVFKLTLTSTPTYVLQLSTGLVGSDPLYLGWLDGGSWVEATSGNTGTAGILAGQHAMSWDDFLVAHPGGFNATTMLGAYGYDASTTTAWAVLDHSSEYALVVPEPTTVGLFGLSLTVLVTLRRRRTV